jgi:hypothetical protein
MRGSVAGKALAEAAAPEVLEVRQGVAPAEEIAAKAVQVVAAQREEAKTQVAEVALMVQSLVDRIPVTGATEKVDARRVPGVVGRAERKATPQATVVRAVEILGHPEWALQGSVGIDLPTD